MWHYYKYAVFRPFLHHGILLFSWRRISAYVSYSYVLHELWKLRRVYLQQNFNMDIVCFTIRRTRPTRRQWRVWRSCSRSWSGVPRSASVWGRNWPKQRQSSRPQWKSESAVTMLENNRSIFGLDKIYQTDFGILWMLARVVDASMLWAYKDSSWHLIFVGEQELLRLLLVTWSCKMVIITLKRESLNSFRKLEIHCPAETGVECLLMMNYSQ